MAGPLTNNVPRFGVLSEPGRIFLTTIENGEPGTPSPTRAHNTPPPLARARDLPQADGGGKCDPPM